MNKKEKVKNYIEKVRKVESSKKIGNKFDVNPSYVRRIIRDNNYREKFGNADKGSEQPSDINMKQLNQESVKLKDFDYKEIFETAKRTQEVEAQINNVRREPVEIELTPDKDGFGRLIPTGDWHIGNMGTNYDALMALITYIKTMNVGMVGVADYMENFIRPIGGNWIPILNQALPPKHQKAAYFSILKDMSKQIKCLLLEWHDDRERRATSMDTMDFLNWNFPIRHNRTVLKVKCGEAEYKGVVAHRLPGSSMYHQLHDNIRELLFSSPDADFIISAHSHVPGDMKRAFRGRKVPLVKVGAFNNDAEYAVSSYGAKSFISCPMLFFDSKKRISTPLQMPGFYLDKVITPKIEEMEDYIS